MGRRGGPSTKNNRGAKKPTIGGEGSPLPQQLLPRRDSAEREEKTWHLRLKRAQLLPEHHFEMSTTGRLARQIDGDDDVGLGIHSGLGVVALDEGLVRVQHDARVKDGRSGGSNVRP